MGTKEQFSILIVDDDPIVVRLLHAMLADFTPVRFATSGRAALKQARESRPDLMLLDVGMLDMSGLEVCRILKADPELADIAVVFLTAHNGDDFRARGLQLGAADFIVKPANVELVNAVVRAQQRAKQKLTDTMRSAMTVDFLTGCANRLQFEKTLAQEWARAQRSKTSLALILIDIVDLKSFNAQHGEQVGEECLHDVAEALRSVVHRPADLLARYSGGKFALLMPETPVEGAEVVSQRACVAVTAGGRVTLQCGIAYGDWRSAGDQDTDAHTHSRLSRLNDKHLLLAAEQALECVKNSKDANVAVADLRRYGEVDAFILQRAG